MTLKWLLRNPIASDIIVETIDRNQYRCHKIILASKSIKLDQECRNSCILMVQYRSDVVNSVLKYIYGGVLEEPENFSDILELIKLSEEWELTSLNLILRKKYTNKNIPSNFSDFSKDGCHTKEDIWKFIQANENDKIYSDFEITDSESGKVYHLHKAILASYSEYFYSMFTKSWKENDEKQVNISVQFPELLYSFFYNRRNIDWENVSFDQLMDLIDIASYYFIDDLTSVCEIEFCKFITLSNVHSLFEISQNFGLDDLRNAVVLFISKNYEEFIKDTETFFITDKDMLRMILNTGYIALDFNTIYESLIQWATHFYAKKTVDELIQDLLPPHVLFNTSNKSFLYNSDLNTLFPFAGSN